MITSSVLISKPILFNIKTNNGTMAIEKTIDKVVRSRLSILSLDQITQVQMKPGIKITNTAPNTSLNDSLRGSDIPRISETTTKTRTKANI